MTLKQAIKDPSWLLERMSNQKVEGNDGPGFRHVNCPEMLWEELVRLVEGLKVEGESWRDALCRVPEAVRRLWWSMYLSGDVAEQLEQAIVAAQHLKREQERRCTCVIMTPRNIYPGGRHLDDSCPVHTIQSREQEPALREIVYKAIFDGCTHIEQTARSDGKCEVCWGVACYVSQALAAQPPQELVGLREALEAVQREIDCPARGTRLGYRHGQYVTISDELRQIVRAALARTAGAPADLER